jgi:hypothetical protein
LRYHKARWGGERLPDEEPQPGGVYGLLTVDIPMVPSRISDAISGANHD